MDGGVTKLADYGRTSDSSDFLNSGVQGSSDPFNEFYGSNTSQQLSAVDLEQLDALGFHTGQASPTAGTISVNNIELTEGNAGTRIATFTVTRVGGSLAFAVNYATSDGTATASSDYVATTGALSFAAGVNTQTISVTINGDTLVESDETFFVDLSGATNGAVISVSRGQCTILNDDVSIASIGPASVSHTEGNGGTTAFTYPVNLDQAPVATQTLAWSAAGAGANPAAAAEFAGGAAPSGKMTFAAGQTSQTITVLVAGHTIVQPDQTFAVALSNPSPGLTLGTASATGTILNDDATLSIAALDADKAEGNRGATPFTFTVTRTGDTSVAHAASWSVSGAAVNGADFAGGVLPSGIVSFAAGQTTQTITVIITPTISAKTMIRCCRSGGSAVHQATSEVQRAVMVLMGTQYATAGRAAIRVCCSAGARRTIGSDW